VSTITTAICIPQSLLDQVSALAEELQMHRSKVVALAVEELITKHENLRILAALNEFYEDAPDPDDEALHQARQRQQRGVVEGEW
jgi:hypothetical protein